MDSRSRLRTSCEQKQSVQSYLNDCLREHERRKELFSLRWVGPDYSHEYLATIEPYPSVLEADMDYLMKVYFQKGRKEFQNCHHRAKDPGKQRLSELVTKYIIEEKPEKSGFQIGILELVKVHPFHIARELRARKAHPLGGEPNKLPKCLEFSGGIHLIPETEEWEPTTILWMMWKSSIDPMPSEDLSNSEEYVNLNFRAPSYTDRKRCMAELKVQPLSASKVVPILKKVIQDLTDTREPAKEKVEYWVKALFPSFYESIYNFYVKHANFAPEITNRRKPIAATFSCRSTRNSGARLQSLSSFRLGKRNAPEHKASTRLAADLKSQQRAVYGNPQTGSDRKRRVVPPDTERRGQKTEPVPCRFKEENMEFLQRDAVNPQLPRDRSEQKLNDSETADFGTSSAVSTCQTSQMGEYQPSMCDSHDISSTPRNSPVRNLARVPTDGSSHVAKTDAERLTLARKQQDRKEIGETNGFRRTGTVPKRSAPKKTNEQYLDQRAHSSFKTMSPHKEADPGKACRDFSSEDLLSTKCRDTRSFSRKQPNKQKAKDSV